MITGKHVLAKLDRPKTMIPNPDYVEPVQPTPEELEEMMRQQMENPDMGYHMGMNGMYPGMDMGYIDDMHNPKEIYLDDCTEEEVMNGLLELYNQPNVANDEYFLKYLDAIKDTNILVAKFAKKLEIKRFKDTLENSNVPYMDHQFQGDELSKNKLTWTITIVEKAIQASTRGTLPVDDVALPEGFEGWVDANNVVVPMTYKQLIGLGVAMTENVSKATYVANELKNQLEKLTNVEDVINFKVELPATYKK
ncbi:DUF4376 domain-containing protein [Campylobacter coli]